MTSQSVDPRTAVPFGPLLEETSAPDVDATVAAAVGARDAWASIGQATRAGALRAVADELDAAASELVVLADRETGLGVPRLTGELARTSFQLRMFADLVDDGRHLGVVIDHEVAGPPPAGHPDLRRLLVPIGPVAVYGASNFPFAFSTAGGDTASALAAGCPVVVKSHPAHPQTSESVGALVAQTLVATGAPRGTFGLVRGFEAGRILVQHPGIRAAAFTGSYAGGRALFDLAVSRPDPIPFYGELGSVNPVVVTVAAAARGHELAVEYVDSLTLGAGQFCTNPGLLIVPGGSEITRHIVDVAASREPGVLLHSGVATAFRTTVDHLKSAPGVRTLLDPGAQEGPGYRSGTVLLAIDAETAIKNLELLRTECFGPAALVIEYDSELDLMALLHRLDGCLVATVHASVDEPLAAILVGRLAQIAGRVVWNGWPTGVAVTAAQHHGGPHPATTNALHTSVGSSAVNRFLRPLALQSMPGSFLPNVLRDRLPS